VTLKVVLAANNTYHIVVGNIWYTYRSQIVILIEFAHSTLCSLVWFLFLGKSLLYLKHIFPPFLFLLVTSYFILKIK
jgi:hypothetical protein